MDLTVISLISGWVRVLHIVNVKFDRNVDILNV